MHRRSRRSAALAIPLALASASLFAAPTAGSCIPLADLLPEPTAAGPIVFIGTVLEVEDVRTEMIVEEWYLGASPVDRVIVVGGRDPGAITSVEWTPAPGGRYVVVAEPASDGTAITGPCQQSEPYLELLAALEARYGEPQLSPFSPLPEGISSPAPVTSPCAPDPSATVQSPPVVTSNDSPLPGSLVHGTPEP
ncbi:hypothetical protein BH23CHL8_BH23CHL8_30920 [soil metagenome]